MHVCREAELKIIFVDLLPSKLLYESFHFDLAFEDLLDSSTNLVVFFVSLLVNYHLNAFNKILKNEFSELACDAQGRYLILGLHRHDLLEKARAVFEGHSLKLFFEVLLECLREIALDLLPAEDSHRPRRFILSKDVIKE